MAENADQNRRQRPSLGTANTSSLIPDSVRKKIQRKASSNPKFDISNFIPLEQALEYLATALHCEFTLTPSQLLTIMRDLDPRIVVEVAGKTLMDKKLLVENFKHYMEKLQREKVLQQSRRSRAGLRRNMILRESLKFGEKHLKANPSATRDLTKRINIAFDSSFDHLLDDELISILESYRTNETKKRRREEMAQLEEAALADLEEQE